MDEDEVELEIDLDGTVIATNVADLALAVDDLGVEITTGVAALDGVALVPGTAWTSGGTGGTMWLAGSGVVESVNGVVGHVVLEAADVGAVPASELEDLRAEVGELRDAIARLVGGPRWSERSRWGE